MPIDSPQKLYLKSYSGVNGVVIIRNNSDYKLLNTIKAHNSYIYDLKFSNDGNFIFTASSDGSIKKFDVTTGKFQKLYRGHEHNVSSISLSLDDKYIVSSEKTGGWGKSVSFKIILWDNEIGQNIRIITEEKDIIKKVCFLSNSQIASGHWDGEIKIWNLNGFKTGSKKLHYPHVESMFYDNLNNKLITGGGDGIHVTDIVNLNIINSIASKSTIESIDVLDNSIVITEWKSDEITILHDYR